MSKILDTMQGKNSKVIAALNQKMLWQGRAAAAQLKSKVDILQQHQEDILQGLGAKSGEAVNLAASTSKNMQAAVNPFSIENLTITMVQAGDDRKSKEKAEKVNAKNIQLFEELNKHIKTISENTKQVVKQNTQAKKEMKGGSGSGSGSGTAAKAKVKKEISSKGSPWMDALAGLAKGLAAWFGGLTAVKALAGLAKMLLVTPIMAVFKGIKVLAGLPKTFYKGLQALGKIGKKGWEGLKTLALGIGSAGATGIQKVKDFASALVDTGEIVTNKITDYFKSRQFRNSGIGRFWADPNGYLNEKFDRFSRLLRTSGQRMSHGMGEFMEEWRNNRATRGRRTWNSIRNAPRNAWRGVRNAPGAMWDGAKRVGRGIANTPGAMWNGLKSGIAGAGNLARGAGTAAVTGAKKAAFAAVGGIAKIAPMFGALMMNPIVLGIAGIAVVGWGIAQLMGYSNEDMAKGVMTWLGETWETMKGIGSAVWGSIKDFFQGYKDLWIIKKVTTWWQKWSIDDTIDGAMRFWEGIKKDPWNTLMDTGTNAWKGFVDLLGEAKDHLIGWVWNPLADMFNKIMNPVLKKLSDFHIIDETKDIFGHYDVKGRDGLRATKNKKNAEKKAQKQKLEDSIEALVVKATLGPLSNTDSMKLSAYMAAYKIANKKDYIFNKDFKDTGLVKGVTSTAKALYTGSGIEKKVNESKKIQAALGKGAGAVDKLNNIFEQLHGAGSSVSGIQNTSKLTNSNRSKLKKALALKESGNVLNKVNSIGFVGLYQFGTPALIDCGFVKKGTKGNKALDNSSVWTIPGGKAAFLKSRNLQEAAMDTYLNINSKRVKVKDNSQAELAGMLAAAHLLGSGGANNRTGADQNGTTFQDYYQLGRNAVDGKITGSDTKVKMASGSTLSDMFSSAGNFFGAAASGKGYQLGSMTKSIGTGTEAAMASNAAAFLGKGFTYSQTNRGVRGAGVLMDGASSMDCSSFVALIVNQTYGIPMTKFGYNTVSQYNYLKSAGNATKINKGQEQPGDIVMYMINYTAGGKNHTAIVSKKNTQIHMSSGANGIVESPINWNGKRDVYIFRINPLGATANVITGMPKIEAPAQTMVNGVPVMTPGGNTMSVVNNSLESLQQEIFNIREGIMTKEQKQLQKEGKDGLYGVIPVPACTH